MNKFLFFCLLFTSLTAIGQHTGHPGGGPDITTTPEREIVCNGFLGLSADLEEKFLKSWNKKYKSSQDFFNHVDYIVIENVIHTLGAMESLKYKKPHECDKNDKHLFELKLSQRPNRKAELILLKNIKESWEEGRKGCKEKFVDRARMQDQLNNVIKLYENSIRK
jgi:hypothetical protein